MKNSAFFLVFVLSLFLFGFGFAMDLSNDYSQSKRARAVNALLDRIAKSLEMKYPMQTIGVTIGMPEGDLRLLGLDFRICGPLTKEELRTILVNSTKIFLVEANADEHVRPSMNHYPFGFDDIEMHLFVVDLTGRDVNDPYIRVARFAKGNLTYRILQDDSNGMPKPRGQCVESYAEALEAMKQEQEGAAQQSEDG